MSTEEYSQEMITEYLLGSLPEAEAERFDELSITDDNFADELNIAENELVDAYVVGNLEGEQLTRFKSHYLASPVRRRRMEFASAFQTFAAREGHEANVLSVHAGFFYAFKDFITGNRMQLGFAASLLAILFIGGLWVIDRRGEIDTAAQNSNVIEPQQQPDNVSGANDVASTDREIDPIQNVEIEPADKGSPVEVNRNARPAKPPVRTKAAIASIVLSPALRSGGVPSFQISKEATDAALLLESDDYSFYRITLVDETSGKNVWSSRSLKAAGKGENKTLNIRIPAGLLQSGIYSAAVTGVKDGEAEIIATYSFRAVLK